MTRRVTSSKWAERAARVGIATRGLVFLVIAYLVARIASGALGGSGSGKSASGPGAAQAIADQTGGAFALIALGVGLELYALFSLLDALRHNESSDAKRWAKRGRAVWSLLLYAAFGIYCFRSAASGSSGSGSAGHSSRQQSQWSARVLRWPGGAFWLGLLGAALVIVAVVIAVRAIKLKFRDHLQRGRMGPRVWRAATALGVIGHVGRGATFALVGWFVLQAAFENDPKKGKGVDGSARMLANSTGGPVLLWVLALALAAFGLYLFLESRYREV
jgi:hypothetical protein